MSGEDGRTCYNCGYIQRNGGAPEPLPDHEIEYCPDLTNGQVFKKTVLVIVSNLQAKKGPALFTSVLFKSVCE